ncbi:MAG: aminomethyl-transferring glycine dehydrogenase [Ignavibacteriaceae bacterium]|nr:aminomethyl-transferring glycine dehydrogenase [Ignavibacteriaceae bacterium]
MNNSIFDTDIFKNRHNGPSADETTAMLKTIGVDSLDTLINETVPEKIRLKHELKLGRGVSEFEYLNHLRELSARNKVNNSFIGMGYYPTITPPVIQRNIFENPGWYTQYTPYQAEIAQGRLEALVNYQTMVSDLTGLPIANASLLDEGTAAAEAMQLLHAYTRASKKDCHKFFVASDIFPQTKDVIITRAEPLDIEIIVGEPEDALKHEGLFGVLFGYPDGYGKVRNLEPLIQQLASAKIYSVIASDLLALALLRPPGEFGADIVIGTSQRFGVPMGFGGPHAAFFATKDEYKRLIPGRIIGASIDAEGNNAYRMALQTREQHIRREKATSNICTAQVLLSVMAGMYAVYHGPQGIRRISVKVHSLASKFNEILAHAGYKQVNTDFFDTLRIQTGAATKVIYNKALDQGFNLRLISDSEIGISMHEAVSVTDFNELAKIFTDAANKQFTPFSEKDFSYSPSFDSVFIRTSEYLTHPVFNSYYSEHEFLRYVKKLESKDLSLTSSMIPLGSCTMKLNAAAEMLGVSYPGFSSIHPFVPKDQVPGYIDLITELESALKEITGFAGVSLQPNSGAQGEYAGLMVIRKYHHARKDFQRKVILIPSSAHGTNPASAVMAGLQVVVVECDDRGNINVEDLASKAKKHSNELAGLMVTYPSTHGVFEESITEICDIIHNNGGLVYMDGANMNAQVGLTSPAAIGADVCHLNLHKTFAIPHGGGGPGMGPICVAAHLVDYLPGHTVVETGGKEGISAVSSAPYGSASILVISLGYIKMLGASGVTEATKYAILNANYIKARLENYYKVLYTGTKGRAAHELIFDMRDFKKTAGIEVEDIAKRLMDYGFHAPTVSFPVAGTLMVEPTESESKAELDRFCDAMISIRQEIAEIETGQFNQTDNVLKNSPHTMSAVMSSDWQRPYSREKAAFPLSYVKDKKFWPSSARINNAYGDRNLVCTCLPVSEYTH